MYLITEEEIAGIHKWLVKNKIRVDMPSPGDWKLTMHKVNHTNYEAERLCREFKVMLIVVFYFKGFAYAPKVSYRLV